MFLFWLNPISVPNGEPKGLGGEELIFCDNGYPNLKSRSCVVLSRKNEYNDKLEASIAEQ